MSAAEPGRAGPIPFHRVLWEELGRLGKRDADAPAPDLKEIYARVGRLGETDAPTALCLSGGGIRSATFNLGVIQALARLGLLERFDYLSSVSGGGFIAGWLKAWAHRAGTGAVAATLAQPTRTPGFEPLEPEPEPIRNLRAYSNYLTPRANLFSVDTWTAVALLARNLFLNWLVLVPVLAFLVAIPQVTLLIAAAQGGLPDGVVSAAWPALGFGLLASAGTNYLRSRRPPATSGPILGSVLLLWIAAALLSLAALRVRPDDLATPSFWGFCALWSVAMPLAGWLLGRVAAGRQTGAAPAGLDAAAILASGAVMGVVLASLSGLWVPWLQDHPPVFVIAVVPLLLGLNLLARSFFVALSSLGVGRRFSVEDANADREWWARLSGVLLIVAVGWMAASALVILGDLYLKELSGWIVAQAGGVSGLVAALLGASSKTGRTAGARPGGRARLVDAGLWLLALAAIACAVVALASLNIRIAEALIGAGDLLVIEGGRAALRLPIGTSLVQAIAAFSLVPCLLGPLLSWVMGRIVNVNIFSAQGLYRNRIVRAYLGASNARRRPDPFTGFDPNDNMPLADLALGGSPRPIPVFNAALNLTSGAVPLAWQERKAESFTMTPLHCGNAHLGYRPADEYGGPHGLTLGAAITISGAAANPNAGYHSSPLVSFLMTLFNVRLGSWLGNPGQPGAGASHRSGPRHAWTPLFGDLFGRADARRAYVSLSDGGHFENLGIYEMVLRRCRFVVVSDAGHDPTHTFEDLGNAIRKVRIDLGVPIEFDREIRILPRPAEAEEGAAKEDDRRDGLACALATIRYDLVDEGALPGRLLYLKPTLRAGRPVPYDVFGYSRTSPRFPHEPTTDQWFSEAQFESYRALGEHLARGLGNGQPLKTVPGLFAIVAGRPGYTRPRDMTARHKTSTAALPPPAGPPGGVWVRPPER